MSAENSICEQLSPSNQSALPASAVLEQLAPLFPRLSSTVIAEAAAQQRPDRDKAQHTAAPSGPAASVNTSVRPAEQLLLLMAVQAAQLISAQPGRNAAGWMPAILCIPSLWDRYYNCLALSDSTEVAGNNAATQGGWNVLYADICVLSEVCCEIFLNLCVAKHAGIPC